MTIVVDASFAVHAATSADADSASAAARALGGERLSVPPIFWHEVASALRMMRLREGLSNALADVAMRNLAELGFSLEPATSDLRAVIATSDRYRLTAYDAAYLELALRTGARLATRDGGLASAARRAGLSLVG